MVGIKTQGDWRRRKPYQHCRKQRMCDRQKATVEKFTRDHLQRKRQFFELGWAPRETQKLWRSKNFEPRVRNDSGASKTVSHSKPSKRAILITQSDFSCIQKVGNSIPDPLRARRGLEGLEQAQCDHQSKPLPITNHHLYIFPQKRLKSSRTTRRISYGNTKACEIKDRGSERIGTV